MQFLIEKNVVKIILGLNGEGLNQVEVPSNNVIIDI